VNNFPPLCTNASVEFQIDVISRNGRLVRRFPKQRNLILNQGLDAIGNALCDFQSAANNVVVGTGALVVKRASGATTVTATAGSLVASAGFFQASDVGRILKLDSGNEYPITAFSSSTGATSSNTANASASPGTIHYVNQVGLITETERSNTVAIARTNTWDAGLGTMTHSVVLLTPILATPRVYTEIGWSWSATVSGSNIFGCAPISPSVSMSVGQRLRVTINLIVKPTPTTPQAVSVGLAVGNWQLEKIGSDVGCPGASTGQFAQLGSLGPALIAPTTGTTPAIGGTILNTTGTLGTYSNGQYKRTATFQFADTAGAVTANSLRFQPGPVATGGRIYEYRLLLSSPIVKTTNDRIDGALEFRWGRELVN
jgi:hypothetical protein